MEVSRWRLWLNAVNVEAVRRQSHPQRAVVTQNHLQIRGLTQDAHVGKNAVVHQMMRSDAITPIFLAHEFVSPLRLLDFSGDGRN